MLRWFACAVLAVMAACASTGGSEPGVAEAVQGLLLQPRPDTSTVARDEVVLLEQVRFEGVAGEEVDVAPGAYRVAVVGDKTLSLSSEGARHLLRAESADVEGPIEQERAILACSPGEPPRLLWVSHAGSLQAVGGGADVRARGMGTQLSLNAVPSLTVTRPGIEWTWYAGTRQAIQWKIDGPRSAYVNIALATMTGSLITSVKMIKAQALNSGNFDWNIPTGLSGSYMIYVQTTDGVARDFSDVFKIGPSPLPVMAAPTVAGSNVTLAWTFVWPYQAKDPDGYFLEQSTTSATSGFTHAAHYPWPISPYMATLSRNNGTYWFRVQASVMGVKTPYSNVVKAQVAGTGQILPPPVMSTPTVSGTSVGLMWTFTWPSTTSTNDAYLLEQSTTSASSGFSQIGTYASRTSPYSVSLSRTAGTYWFRVRARVGTGSTAYSSVVTAQVGGTGVSSVKFVNNSVWSVIYLTIDGIQQFATVNTGIAPGGAYEKQLAAGTHSYEAHTGTWNGDGSRFELYYVKQSFTLQSGTTMTINIVNPTIQQLLTKFQSSGRWRGEWYDANLGFHLREFKFYSNGSFDLSDDGIRFASGTYSLVSYVAGSVTFKVTYSTGASYTGTMNEIYGYFYMSNGPASWRQIQYTYQGP